MTARKENKTASPQRTTSFPGFFNALLHKQGAASLANLDYARECEAKELALAKFWSQHQLPGEPEGLVRSPRPRHYRTTSKRRIRVDKGLVIAELSGAEISLPANDLQLLEAEQHKNIYHFLLGLLRKPAWLDFARRLNYIIIRGSYTSFSVILNVDRFDAAVLRKGKLIARHLQESDLNILSVFMFLDPSRSDYYFETRRPDASLTFKKLYGPEKLSLTLNGQRFLYEPTGFSQVNESILPLLIEQVGKLLGKVEKGQLADLYCGYGLFALQLAENYERVFAMDVSSAAIRNAAENKHHLRRDAEIQFRAQAIDSRSLRRFLKPNASGREHIILDPPRQGVANGVIPYLAERESEKIVHIFCGIEQIPHHLPVWLHGGYRVTRIVPLDMFPGTPNLEIILLFEPRPVHTRPKDQAVAAKKDIEKPAASRKPPKYAKFAERREKVKLRHSRKLQGKRSHLKGEK